MNPNRILTLVALSALVMGAVAVPATAHAGDDRAAHHREAAEQARAMRDGHDRHDRAHDIHERFCGDEDNLTEREQERCDRIRDAHEPGHEARRAAHALVKAIDAHYARVGKLEMKEYEIEQQLADGNLSDNETQRLEHALVVIEAQQNKTLDRVAHLEERLDALKAKWAEVEEHVREQRAKRGDDHEDCAAEKAEELAEAEAELNESLEEAAAERDAVFDDPNSTDEERAEAEAEYNATVEEAHAEYDEEVAEAEAEHEECLADASEEDDPDDADESDDDSQDESEDESEEESEDESEDEA